MSVFELKLCIIKEISCEAKELEGRGDANGNLESAYNRSVLT